MKDFDKYIKNELNKSVEDSSPSDYLKNKIDLEINSQGEKGEFKMKKKICISSSCCPCPFSGRLCNRKNHRNNFIFNIIL